VLTLHYTFISSIVTCACPNWNFAADTYILRLQHLQNKGLHTTGNFPRHTPICKLYVAFNILYVYDLITILSRQQAAVLKNHNNVTVCNIGQGKMTHRKCPRLRLCSGQAYDRSSDLSCHYSIG